MDPAGASEPAVPPFDAEIVDDTEIVDRDRPEADEGVIIRDRRKLAGYRQPPAPGRPSSVAFRETREKAPDRPRQVEPDARRVREVVRRLEVLRAENAARQHRIVDLGRALEITGARLGDAEADLTRVAAKLAALLAQIGGRSLDEARREIAALEQSADMRIARAQRRATEVIAAAEHRAEEIQRESERQRATRVGQAESEAQSVLAAAADRAAELLRFVDPDQTRAHRAALLASAREEAGALVEAARREAAKIVEHAGEPDPAGTGNSTPNPGAAPQPPGGSSLPKRVAAHGGRIVSAPPRFSIREVGYHRGQVDTYVTATRDAAPPEIWPAARFDTVADGYDQMEVSRYVNEVTLLLGDG